MFFEYIYEFYGLNEFDYEQLEGWEQDALWDEYQLATDDNFDDLSDLENIDLFDLDISDGEFIAFVASL